MRPPRYYGQDLWPNGGRINRYNTRTSSFLNIKKSHPN